MFHVVRNNGFHGTPAERAAVRSLRDRLPDDWTVEIGAPASDGARMVIRAPDGRRAEVTLVARKRVLPREVAGLVGGAQASGRPVLLTAPFLGPRARELIAGAEASYVDLTGNLRLVLRDPAVFIEGRGAERDPARQARALQSLKGAAAGRTVRALCDFRPPYGVRALAEASATPLGTVSRVVSLLEEEALLTRDERKRITAVDWPALIARWAQDYSVRGANRVASYLEPRGLSALAGRLERLDRYAVTGSLAGTGITAPRLAMVYVPDAEDAAAALDLVPAEAGANVWLLEPFDAVVFERCRAVSLGSALAVTAAAPSQVAADLLTSPGRGPQEAEALIEDMKGDEDAWRRDPGS